MSTFHLRMLRPDTEFFSGEVEMLDVLTPRGRETVLAGHMPMFINLDLGMCKFRLADGSEKTFAQGEGMLSIGRDEVVLQSDFLAWEEKLSRAIAHRVELMESERKRRKDSYLEYRRSKVDMAKRFISLQDKHDGDIDL